VDRLLHEDARCGSAALPLAGEAHSGDSAVNSLPQICIVHHDHRALATELERHRDELLSGSPIDDLPRLHGASESDLAHVLVRDQRPTAFGAHARQDIEHPGRQDLIHDLAGPQHRERCLLRRLTTTALPATRAGAIFSAISIIGTFQE
jgi:ParB family chromosome partitioning protein